MARRTMQSRFRRPFQVRWKDLGPPRLELSQPQLTKAEFKYGSVVDRISRIFLAMAPETQAAVLEALRDQFGDGAYAYAKRTIEMWKPGEVIQVGQAVMRLVDVVPRFVDLPTKFELALILRQETLARLRQVNMTLTVRADEQPHEAVRQLKEIIDTQLNLSMPEGVMETRAWLSTAHAAFFEEMVREGERRLLYAQAKDFFRTVAVVQKIRCQVQIPVIISAVFELPISNFTLRIVQPNGDKMSEELLHTDDSGLLAQWSDLELETRFKSGEVSYPEYVLRNMDKIFTKEERGELHKIAAMHGLELERLLMEIQIKQRTSEADLQKLLTTLRTLQEKRITADVVSRHETPSGHIEISARSRRSMGCIGGVMMLVSFIGLIGTAAVGLLNLISFLAP